MHREIELAETPGIDTISRRDFLGCGLRLGMGLCAAGALGPAVLAGAERPLKEAMYYQRLADGSTRCQLCPNQCVRQPGEVGDCLVRLNRGGRYYSLVYNRACVVALDSIEKCPLYHFQIQGKAFSVATAGCNLSCAYCQNWAFSQRGPDAAPKSYELSPSEIVAKAKENGAGAIAFFYTEPTVYYEYMLDIARLSRRAGLKNVMVTAGYINPEPLKAALPHIDAVVLGLKGWNERFYEEYIGGKLSHVKETIKVLADANDVWWEVVSLVIPSLNDDLGEIADMAGWLRQTAGAERPLHFTRFRPEFRLKRLPMTPTTTLTKARGIALAQGLQHVYVGNLPGHEGANTSCTNCGGLLVERFGFTILKNNIRSGKCAHCQRRVVGAWS